MGRGIVPEEFERLANPGCASPLGIILLFYCHADAPILELEEWYGCI